MRCLFFCFFWGGAGSCTSLPPLFLPLPSVIICFELKCWSFCWTLNLLVEWVVDRCWLNLNRQSSCPSMTISSHIHCPLSYESAPDRISYILQASTVWKNLSGLNKMKWTKYKFIQFIVDVSNSCQSIDHHSPTSSIFKLQEEANNDNQLLPQPTNEQMVPTHQHTHHSASVQEQLRGDCNVHLPSLSDWFQQSTHKFY